jgi:hypothetical protein
MRTQIFTYWSISLVCSLLLIETFSFWNNITTASLMFVPCIAWLSIINQHYVLSYITPLFDTQAPTYFGIHVPTSGSFSCPRELLESRNVYVISHIRTVRAGGLCALIVVVPYVMLSSWAHTCWLWPLTLMLIYFQVSMLRYIINNFRWIQFFRIIVIILTPFYFNVDVFRVQHNTRSHNNPCTQTTNSHSVWQTT